MIEQAMFFALGILVAGLLGLMVLPALWRRAVRLSTRRLEMQVPLSMEEVLAERDLLRAEFAVAGRKLEEQLTQVAQAHARDRAELGRKTVALTRESEALAQVRTELARVESALAQAQTAQVEMQAQLGAALVEAYDGASARERAAALIEDVRKRQQLLDESRLTIAGLETRLLHAQAVSTRDEDAHLRRSIAELGGDVLRIAKALEDAPVRQDTPVKKAKGARAAVG